MKNKELIIKITGHKAEQAKSDKSIINNHNLNQMGFDVVDIGSSKDGFDWTDLAAIADYTKTQDQEYMNFIIDAHGVIEDNYFMIKVGNYLVSGFVVLQTIQGLTDGKKLNIIMSSCHGEGIHNNIITKMGDHLPEGSKLITLSNVNSPTVSSDFFSNRINELSKIFSDHQMKFIDLVKLYCISKRASENVPVIGIQTKEGYKAISFDKIVQDMVVHNKEITFSPFLNEIFSNNILQQNIMNKVIDILKSKANNPQAMDLIKIDPATGTKALGALKTGHKIEFLNELSKNYYSDQSLDFLSFSKLDPLCNKHHNKIMQQAIELRDGILNKYPHLDGYTKACGQIDMGSYDTAMNTGDIGEISKFIHSINHLTNINVTDFWNEIGPSMAKIREMSSEIKGLLSYIEFIESLEDSLDKQLKDWIEDAIALRSPFSYEEGIICNTEEFTNLIGEHDHVLSNHGYLMVLGADNLDLSSSL